MTQWFKYITIIQCAVTIGEWGEDSKDESTESGEKIAERSSVWQSVKLWIYLHRAGLWADFIGVKRVRQQSSAAASLYCYILLVPRWLAGHVVRSHKQPNTQWLFSLSLSFILGYWGIATIKYPAQPLACTVNAVIQLVYSKTPQQSASHQISKCHWC